MSVYNIKDIKGSPLSAALRIPILSSPNYGIFSLRSGEDSYMLFTSVLIARCSSTGSGAGSLLVSHRKEPQDPVLGKVKRVGGRRVE